MDANAASEAGAGGRPADRVTFSYPADLSAWGRDIIEREPFRSYLRKARGRVRPGETVEEFVGVGCCGDTLDVPLRVERVEGGTAVGETTTVEFTVREACGIDGGWLVQSAAGPDGDGTDGASGTTGE